MPPADHAIPERVRLVIALTEVNSRHLGSESRRAGIEVVLARVEADWAAGAAGPDAPCQIAMLRADMAEAEAALAAIEAERERLYAALEAAEAKGDAHRHQQDRHGGPE